ncbi:hypothetical protein MF672_038680 [Actinomadura sp. ATCC 31491]|uniref:Uncharacterized protein n=1 Tax=Actinomadura luzonensis TaxID=2805427 RepID=A0ABT0G4Z4_9ACTN|nr:hypothetical protein [Actinomadura luzonensis]MCK2219680.1 hypothetical protein [Actinomadura luzonensis]
MTEHHRWEPYIPARTRLRVIEASCCEAFILAYEEGDFFVWRHAAAGRFEQTARGPYRLAFLAWMALITTHPKHNREVTPEHLATAPQA